MTDGDHHVARHVVCRCEEITAAEVVQAIAEGALTINDVKRRTRAGMGPCQGIFCGRPIANLIYQYGNVPRDRIEPMTARPPVRLLPLGMLADLDDAD